VLAALVW